MASGNPNIAEIGKKTRWKKGQAAVGGKPKGSKHINTWIQELLEDETFTTMIRDGLELKEYKGAPIKAMIMAQMRLAVNGDSKAFDSLAKYGWSQKTENEHKVEMVTPILGGAVKQAIDVSSDPDNP